MNRLGATMMVGLGAALLALAMPGLSRAGALGGRSADAAEKRSRGKDRVAVPAGSFQMGSPAGEGNPDEAPLHRPTLDRFAVDRHEVTNAGYQRCVQAGVCTPPGKRGSKTRGSYFGDPRFARYPVVNVSWHQAARYCAWRGGRLPSEAEWEKAARGDKDRRRYPWGDQKPDCSRANFGGPDGCSGDTAQVGGRPAGKSPYGAHDMAGNVWEWTGDWYDPTYYRRAPAKNPKGPRWGAFKVMRGGCYDTAPEGLRVSCRNRDFPTAQQPNVGFRCAYPAGAR